MYQMVTSVPNVSRNDGGYNYWPSTVSEEICNCTTNPYKSYVRYLHTLQLFFPGLQVFHDLSQLRLYHFAKAAAQLV